jgi:hypothetical protein
MADGPKSKYRPDLLQRLHNAIDAGKIRLQTRCDEDEAEERAFERMVEQAEAGTLGKPQAEITKAAGPRPSTNALMMDKLTSVPESHGWSIRTWAKEIKRSVGAIQATPAWKKLNEAQAEAKATAQLERAKLNRPGRRRQK